MNQANLLASSDRVIIAAFENEFAQLHLRYCSLIRATPESDIYHSLGQSDGRSLPSVGESVLRGVAAVEQTFGGITANLWDDPFEWTLPEILSTAARIVEYLEEVESTRRLAFASFLRDEDLLKEIMLPSEETRALVDLLVLTLVKAAESYGRAAAARSLLSETMTPEVSA